MRRRSLFIVFLVVFIDLMGFGIVLPLLPRYAERFGASGLLLGAVAAVYSMMQLLFSPFWSSLSDRAGRRPILLLGTLAASGSYALFGWASSEAIRPGLALELILLSRALAGIFSANISVASAYIADTTSGARRAHGMALFGVAFGLGFVLGPAIGGLSFQQWGLAGPGWVAAALCGANFILGFFALEENLPPERAQAAQANRRAAWRNVLRRPTLRFLVGLSFLTAFCFSNFETILPLYLGTAQFHPRDFPRPYTLARELGAGNGPVESQVRGLLPPHAGPALADPEWIPRAALQQILTKQFNRALADPRLPALPVWKEAPLRKRVRRLLARARPPGESDARLNRMLLEDGFLGMIQPRPFLLSEGRIAYLFAFCGFVTALVQGSVSRLVYRFGSPKLVIRSLCLLGGSLLFLPMASNHIQLVLGLTAISAGAGLNWAPLIGLISTLSNEREQGATLGVAQSANTLGRALGPLCAAGFYTWDIRLPYLAAGALALAGGFIAARRLRRV